MLYAHLPLRLFYTCLHTQITTFHISTLSVAERAAAAKSLLPDAALSKRSADSTEAGAASNSRRPSNSDSNTSGTSRGSDEQLDMLETCECCALMGGDVVQLHMHVQAAVA